jgi:FMN reductase
MTTNRLPDPDDRPVRILGIGGSTRRESRTLAVLRAVLALAGEQGATTTLAAVRELDLPLYNEDIPLDRQPASLHWLLEQVQAADAFVLGSPTYHGTISGALKNVLDALHIRHGEERTYFDRRPVGLLAYGGPSALNVINALSHSVRGMRGLQTPTVLTVARAAMDESFTHIADETTRKRASQMVSEVIHFARMHRLAERHAEQKRIAGV